MINLDKFKILLDTFGYVIPKNAEFYLVQYHDENKNKIGMKVGGFTHSCHLGGTDFIILFFMDEKINNYHIKEYSDLWDIEKIS